MKKIIILGLLLIPSFSFAVNNVEDLGSYEDLGGNNNCTINSDLSFDCSESNNVIVGTDTSWYKSSTSYFWTTSGLAVYIHQQNGSDIQGLITSFAIAGNEFPSYSRTISYEDFLNYYNNNELTNWAWAGSVTTNGWAGPDFIFGDTHIFFYPVTSSSFAGSINPVNFGLVGWGLDANYQGVINSPISDNNTTIPDTNDVCITVQQFFDIYGSTNNYNTGLCYTQDRYLTQTGGRVQITPKFITELYPTYQEFRQDVNTRQNYCTPPATQQACQQAFSGKEENRTLINKLQQGTDTAIIYDMCNIYQTRSGNMQKNFCDMTDEERKKIGENTVTTEKYAERLANNQTTTTRPTTGTVFDGIIDESNRDILKAIPRVYTKITSIFKDRTGKNGVIPFYITGLLLVIVLFELFKK